MHKKSDIEFEKFKISKITRALIRLRKSVEADEEINAVLPDRLREFDLALQQGQLKGMDSDLLEVKNWESNAEK